jgi:hypothetical protein
LLDIAVSAAAWSSARRLSTGAVTNVLAGIESTTMDKAEFIKLAPKYYALAIGLRFTKNDGPQTRQSIMIEYMAHEEGAPPEEAYSLVDDFTIWNRAIDWLVESNLISAFTDPFGPPVYLKDDTFDSRWNDLCRDQSPFQNANASGDAGRWTYQALDSVYREYIKLGIRSSDFENPEREWAPIPLDRNSEALQAAVVSLDETITQVEQSNGYASEYPEERNFVLDNLRLLSQKLKSAGTVSVSYVRAHGLNVLKRVQDRFIDTSIGEGAKETTNAIVHWLHEIVNYFVS